MRVIHVPKECVAEKWHEVEPLFANTENLTGGEFTLDQLKVFAETGKVVLAVAEDDKGKVFGAFTIAFRDELNGRVAYLTMLGGYMLTNKEVYSAFKNLLRSFGATKVRGSASPSIARLWRRIGLTQQYIVVGGDI